MVVTTAPIILGNHPEVNAETDHTPLAFLGQVPVKVDGPVQAGDFILPSGREDGIGLAVSLEQLDSTQFGWVVGQALETSKGVGVKEVQVMVGLGQEQLWSRLMKEKETQISALADRVAALEATAQTQATQIQPADSITFEWFSSALLLAGLMVWLKGRREKGGRS